jgi:AraC-like DNA-binding protein
VSDVLDLVLHTLKIRTTLFAMAPLTGIWGVSFPERGPDRGLAYFHAIAGGPCWLQLPGRQDLALSDGDVVLLAHGSGHHVVSDRGGRALVEFDASTWVPNAVTRAEPTDHGTGRHTSTLVCGAVDVPGPQTHPLLGLLPDVVTFPSGGAGSSDLELTLTLLRRETQTPSPGSSTLLARLGDVLLVQLLRSWIARQEPVVGGWLGALRDPGLAAALHAIHERPDAPWTVETLAARATMSRTRFADRFTSDVGVPPLAYVTQWRMACASRLLAEGHSVGEAARAVGYSSEPAFSRAFSRTFGIPPSHVKAS